MRHTLKRDEWRGGRGMFNRRRRWRIRPRLLELEARTLLSTIVVNAGNLTLIQDVLSADVAQGVAGGGLFGDGAAPGRRRGERGRGDTDCLE